MTKKIPEGFTTITPSLNLENCADAIALYTQAFGAKDLGTVKGPNGKIMHACLEIGDAKIFLADATPECGGARTGAFYLYVEDVDGAFTKAKKAGLSETMPPTDMFWGDRMGNLNDKFGCNWTIATHVKDLSPEEMEKGKNAFIEQMSKTKAA